jgi:hypothetical protein
VCFVFDYRGNLWYNLDAFTSKRRPSEQTAFPSCERSVPAG